MSNRLRHALRLEAITVAWMIVEAAAAIGAGVVAHSILLVAFGVDSLIELISACVLYWRLARELRGGAGNEHAERRAARISGWLLFALALYVLVHAGYGLVHHDEAQPSWLGIAVAVTACLAMPLLGRAKLRMAAEIGSRALRADAIETLACGYLSWVLLIGLVANALLRLWWLDGVAALGLIPFLVREGREALEGECCGCES